MNVIFHTATAIGVTVLLTDTDRLGDSPGLKQVLPTALYAFPTGIISHGVLDYITLCVLVEMFRTLNGDKVIR